MDKNFSHKMRLKHFNRFFLQMIATVSFLHMAVAGTVAYKVYYPA